MRLSRVLRRRLAAEGGYSLVELIVVLAILVTIVGALTTLFVSGSSAETKLNNRFQAQSNARVALDRMRREIHNACGVGTTSGTLVQLAFPTNCPSTGAATPTVTYCTSGSGSRFKLYRIASSTSNCTNGVILVDYLTSGSIFAYTDKNVPSGSYLLARLHVDLQVNVTPTVTANRYRLIDDIVFRNSLRS